MTTDNMVPCCISWCIALTDHIFCPLHRKDQALRPQEYRHTPPVKKTFPPTPWDQERPWYDRNPR